VSHFRIDIRQRAEEVLALYPRPRSAMLPLLHLAQEQDGYVSDEGIAEVAELTLTTRPTYAAPRSSTTCSISSRSAATS